MYVLVHGKLDKTKIIKPNPSPQQKRKTTEWTLELRMIM